MLWPVTGYEESNQRPRPSVTLGFSCPPPSFPMVCRQRYSLPEVSDDFLHQEKRQLLDRLKSMINQGIYGVQNSKFILWHYSSPKLLGTLVHEIQQKIIEADNTCDRWHAMEKNHKNRSFKKSTIIFGDILMRYNTVQDKSRVAPVPKTISIHSAILTQYWPVTDRQTDRQTPGHSIYRYCAMHICCITLHRKNHQREPRIIQHHIERRDKITAMVMSYCTVPRDDAHIVKQVSRLDWFSRCWNCITVGDCGRDGVESHTATRTARHRTLNVLADTHTKKPCHLDLKKK